MSDLLPDSATAEDYYQAGLNQGMGDIRQMVAYFRQALERDPDHLEACHQLAEKLAWSGQWAESLNYYDRAIARNPDDSDLWWGRAEVLHNLQRLEEALGSYDRAIALLDPDVLQGSVWMGRGAILVALGRLEEAVSSYDRAVDLFLNPAEQSGGYDLDDCYADRGDALFALERYEEAIASYNQAVGLKAISTHNRMKAYVALGQEDDLLALYDRNEFQLYQPDDIWQMKGDVLMYANRYREALECFMQALSLNPDGNPLRLERIQEAAKRLGDQ